MSVSGLVLSPIRDESILSPGHFHSLPDPSSSESILIYLTVSGSLIPMRVLESDSIASVKLRIQTCKGFVVKKQKLVFGGRELARNDSLVREYGVTDGNILHLVLKLSDLQVITVRTAAGKEYEFHVERNRNVGYVKQQIAKKEEDFDDVKDQELICNGEKLHDQCLIDDISKNNDAVIHLLVRKSAKVRARPVEKNFELSIVASNTNERRDDEEVVGEEETDELQVVGRKLPDSDLLLEPVVVNPKIKLPSVIRGMINSTFAGLEKGNQPIRSSEGSGGAYFMPDSLGHSYVSVFKPIDEEPMAINNPCGLPLSSDGEGLKRGTRVGEGAFREVAAYVLDHPRGGPQPFSSDKIGFSGVPPTILVRCLHEGFHHPEGFEFAAKNIKIGSLQMFMKNYGSCEDMGPQAFPVEEVHKISVLDIRLANADRHAGNILISKDGESGRTVLIPIDHGYCLPDNFEDCTFDWLYWPQARQPYSPETIDYIRSLDAEEDIAILKFHGWDLPLEAARTLRISTMLLKKGVERGFTPFTIGSIMCRETLNRESMIEEIVHEAEDSVLPGTSETTFLETVSQIMDHRLNELTV
ncbi:Phosphatidylinositol 3-/4-kinase [Macleaya cordata]|uniref:1-phosphatidylinositol 4-kinase n=1 Tax=Macleaya cordata TaxID=56857 RepID=A0A200PRZ0_MACCD|nr:Phosphatidylinositol 3-/4-kinase [Macleaya cordata]